MGKTRLKTDDEPEFINLNLSGNQTNINANTEVVFVEESSNGLSVSANRVTLKAGKTYVLNSSLRHLGTQGSSRALYTWRNYTDNVNIGKECHVIAMEFVTSDASQPTITHIIKPTTNIDVGVRCTTVSPANQGLESDATQASIYEI